MNSREEQKNQFLKQHNLDNSKLEKLRQDASFRSYERLILDDTSYILMDAPPEKEQILPFIDIGNFLYQQELSVPKIIAKDITNGFLLLEDFGDGIYSKIIDSEEEREEYLYKNAINALVNLQNIEVPYNLLSEYDDEKLIKEALLLTDWYLPILNGEEISEKLVEEYKDILLSLFPYTKSIPQTIVHRDYHADNLMWLEEREAVKRVGILDFQDAVIGSPIYDIVSLLEDVRRDVDPEVSGNMITHYLDLNPTISRKDFLASYSILGVQRNLKIMGFVARKIIRDKNSSYLSLLPRAWRYVEQDLRHPLLLPLKKWMDKVVSPGIRNQMERSRKVLA